jgi:hypothetical protein
LSVKESGFGRSAGRAVGFAAGVSREYTAAYTLRRMDPSIEGH